MTDIKADHPQHATPKRKPWHRLIGLAVLIATGASLLLFLKSSFGFVPPGQASVLANRWSGSLTLQPEGPCLQLPLIHELRTFPTGSLTYTDQRGTRSDGEAPYNSFEGLPIGLEVTVRYAIPREQLVTIATRFSDGATQQLVGTAGQDKARSRSSRLAWDEAPERAVPPRGRPRSPRTPSRGSSGARGWGNGSRRRHIRRARIGRHRG